jgi:hypothetical protein
LLICPKVARNLILLGTEGVSLVGVGKNIMSIVSKEEIPWQILKLTAHVFIVSGTLIKEIYARWATSKCHGCI